MSIRGRGTLVVNPSSNPFFQTASQTIGADPYRKSDWERNRDEKNKRTEASSNKTFAFQFTRESDTIGSVPPHNDEPPIVNTQLDIPSSQVNNVTITDGHLVKLSAESVLSNYEHETKKEHPCYITTAVSFEYYQLFWVDNFVTKILRFINANKL